MKKRLLSAALAVAMLFGSAAALPEGVFETSSTITASANYGDYKSGDYYYRSLSDGTVEITEYVGKSAKLTIPSILGGKKVSMIGYSAFAGKTSLTSITIPSTVEIIRYQAFENCTNLKSVVMSKGVESIQQRAFIGCKNLSSITIPGSVTSIGGNAFKDTKWLKNKQKSNRFVIVNGILIDGNTCTGKISIPKTVKCIGEHAFSECGNLLTNVTIPKSVTNICQGAFMGCSGIKSMTIPNSVKNMEGYVFYDCTSLTSISLPSGIKSIGSNMFCGCSKLKSITIPKGVTIIDEYAFLECKSLTSISIPSSVKSIKDYAFLNCNNLKRITIPKSVTSFGEKAIGYYCVDDIDSCKKVKGFTIYGEKGSGAEKYAKNNGFKFVAHRMTEPKVSRFAGANRYETASIISKKMNPKTSGTVIIATGLTFHDAMVAVPLASAYNVPLLLATEKHITAQTEAELKRLKAKNVIVVSTNGAIGAKAKAELKALNLKATYIEGKTCFETAAKVAKALQTKTKKAPTTIFFATDSAFADALSASPVAAIKNAPIMYLKNTGSIDKATADYLKSVKGKVKNAYIIGGDGVISDAMMKNVANALGLTVNKTVVRVAGKNRYETCTAVNNKFKSVLTGDGICVAKGLDFPDALAGGVYAASTKQALFLADGKKLQDCQNTYLKSKNASKITVFGGTGAVPDELVKLIAQASV